MAIISWRELSASGTPTGPTLFIDFDATLLEEYNRAANVTTYPVESGGVLSDHIQPQQRAISLEVFVTDTPIKIDRPEPGNRVNQAKPSTGLISARDLTPALRAHTEPVAGIPSQRLVRGNVERVRKPDQRTAVLLTFPGGVTRVVDIFTVFESLMDKRQPVSVQIFANQEFDNMVITQLTAPRTPENGSGLTFSLDLIEMVPATVQRTQTKKAPRQPAQPKHAPETDSGVIQLKPFNITASPQGSKLERLEAEQRARLAQWDAAVEDAISGGL